MPKVKRIEYRIAGGYPKEVFVKFSVEGRYKGPPKDFSIELPSDMAFALDQKYVSHKDIDACITAFREAVKQFETHSLKREKVIVYEFEASERAKSKTRIACERRELPEYDKDREIEKTIDDFDYGWSSERGRRDRGLKIGWQLADRVQHGDTVEFQNQKDGASISVDNEKIKWMKWTPEREAFFQNLDVALDALVARAAYVLDEPANHFASLIDKNSGVLALGFGGK